MIQGAAERYLAARGKGFGQLFLVGIERPVSAGRQGAAVQGNIGKCRLHPAVTAAADFGGDNAADFIFPFGGERRMPGHLARGGTEDEKQHQAGGKTQPVPQEKNSGNGRQAGKPREERGGDSPTQEDAGHEQQAGRGQKPGPPAGGHTERTAPGDARVTEGCTAWACRRS